MRVLFLGPASSCHITRWVRFMRERGDDVLLATMHAVPEGEEAISVPLASGLTTGGTRPGTFFRSIKGLRRLAAEFQPEVTVAYYMSSYGLLGALAGLKPLVGAAAGGDVLVDEEDSLLRRVQIRLFLSYVLRRCRGMLSWADHVAARLEEVGFPPERILVQPRGVDRNLFPYRTPRERTNGQPLRVLSIRWLKPLYRVDTLINALARLNSAGLPFEARIGGEGSERSRLEQLATDLDIRTQVDFAGEIPPEEVSGHLAWSDVYVSTSSSDGASSSLFEALSVGTCPVITEIQANRPFVEPGVTGEFFPVGDDASLASALERLARDEALRLAQIEGARDFVAQRLDYRVNMERIAGYLAGVVAESRS